MKKRKILAMLMVAALSAGMLAGCGSDDTKEESKSTEADTKENSARKRLARKKPYMSLQTVPEKSAK